MSRKVFVSYKYMDSSVMKLEPNQYLPSWPSDYVKYLEDNVLINQIYKGERQDEDLSYKDDEYIWNHLKDKLYDSSVTVVLISPNMRNQNTLQRNQWIPWEISYSLRKTTRGGRTSQRNSIVAVILPDLNGSYDYFKKMNLFDILANNITNGYIYLTQWDTFVRYSELCFVLAEQNKNKVSEYNLQISI